MKKRVRKLVKNTLDFLVINVIPNNLFVSIGYFHDSALGYGPKTRKKVNKDNDEKLRGYINGEELINSPRFRKQLQAFADSDKYQQVLSGERNSAPMNIEGNVHIIKISRLIVRWMQNSRFLSQYHKLEQDEQKIRYNHGFGKSEEEYDQLDWRRKPEHKGLRIYPDMTKRNERGPRHFSNSVGQSGLYTSEEEPNRFSIRQFVDLSLTEKPEWYFIDENGEPEKLNNNVLRFLNTAYSEHKVKEAIQEISEDEKAFINDIKNLQDNFKTENEFFLENTLYITGTSINMKGEKEPFTWVNTDLLYEKYPWLNRRFINSIIEKYTEFSIEEIEKLSEGKFYKNYENALLEAIDSGIKKALNILNKKSLD